MPSTELTQASDRETRLANAISALSERELQAYRYFVKTKQETPLEERADELFVLYSQGADCEEIRRQSKRYSLSQVVACKVIYSWDARKAEHKEQLQVDVPQRAAQVHLEQVDYLADLLTAAQVQHRAKIRQFLATGGTDKTLLEGVPLPKTFKEYRDLFELFMRGTGQDKKRVEVSGTVRLDSSTGAANVVTAAEAESIMDRLLGEAVDVESTPAEK